MISVYGIVYLLTNNLNGKQYVGQTTTSLESRFAQHLDATKPSVIGKALKKYDKTNFNKAVVFCAFDKESLDAAEVALIVDVKSRAPFGYNLKAGGSYGKHHLASRLKMSIAATGKTKSPEHISHLSEAMRGKKLSQEHRDKVSAGLCGHKCSEETRIKIAASIRGRKHSAETLRKISLAVSHARSQPEIREKMAASQRGKVASRETRAKMSTAATKAWAARKAKHVILVGEMGC